MPKFTVVLPLAGSVTFSGVEAETAEKAIEAALNMDVAEGVEEWETMIHLVRGNICSAPCTQASAEEE